MENIKLFGLILLSSITILQAADLVEKRTLGSMNSPTVSNNWAAKIKSALKYVVTKGAELHDESELQDPRTLDQQYSKFIKNLEKYMAKALNNIKEMFETFQIVRNKKNVMLQKMRELDQNIQILNDSMQTFCNESIQNSQMTVSEKQGYVFTAQKLSSMYSSLEDKVNRKIELFRKLEFDIKNQIVNNPCLIFKGVMIDFEQVCMDELVKRFMNELDHYNTFFDFVESAEYKAVLAGHYNLSQNFENIKKANNQ